VSELDRLREQLVYLRLWLGIIVVAEISLVGWVASAVQTVSITLLSLAIATAVLLGLGIFMLHRQIQRRIDEIGRLLRWTSLLASLCLPSRFSSSALHSTQRVANSAF
jgi:hypothetical protein